MAGKQSPEYKTHHQGVCSHTNKLINLSWSRSRVSGFQTELTNFAVTKSWKNKHMNQLQQVHAIATGKPSDEKLSNELSYIVKNVLTHTLERKV